MKFRQKVQKFNSSCKFTILNEVKVLFLSENLHKLLMPESHIKAPWRNKKEIENFLINAHFSMKTYWERERWSRGKVISIGHYVKFLAHHITKSFRFDIFYAVWGKIFSIASNVPLTLVMKRAFDVVLVYLNGRISFKMLLCHNIFQENSIVNLIWLHADFQRKWK